MPTFANNNNNNCFNKKQKKETSINQDVKSSNQVLQANQGNVLVEFIQASFISFRCS